ncbi:MAG: methyltransferase domain-containing protein [Cytophagales bacterium]|nr:methyltransferase domain-containing protein [Cytophagales bacterium]
MTTQNTPEVTAAYDQVARTYADKYQDEILLKPKVQAFLADFVAAVPPDGIIADMGCGPGQVARYVQGHLGRRTAGIDLSPEMVRIAAELNPTIPFRAADVLQMTETEVYDALIGLYFIVNFPVATLDSLFGKLHQLLKPGGQLLLSFHLGEDQVRRVEDFLNSGKSLDFYFFRVETVREKLRRNGFTVKEVRRRDPYVGVEYESQRAYVFARKE